MAKFWYSIVKNRPQSETDGPSLIQRGSATGIESRSSDELNFLEPLTDFFVNHDKSREFCSCNSYYEISNHKHQHLMTGIQKHSCCLLKDPYETLKLFDTNKKSILQIIKTEFSGYLSTKMRFVISYSTSGSRLGEVVRISEFLERPKYEINDMHGDSLFSMSSNSVNERRCNNIDHFIVGKMGKMAHVREENSIICFKLNQAASVTEKALLLSLVLILDFARRASE